MKLRMAPTVALCFIMLVTLPTGAQGVGIDWPAYLNGPDHTSYQPGALAITPANAPSLTRRWSWKPAAPTKPGQPGALLYASPTVSAGRVYIGAHTGVFYALNESTGAVVWKRFLGFTPQLTCDRRGITSTATVAMDPALGQKVVYVASGDGFLFALKASDGSVVWRSQVLKTVVNNQNAGYLWASPTVVSGHVYMGLSSHCDVPLIRAGLKELDQSTGQLLATYLTVPKGAKGGSIWSSPAATSDGGSVFVTTGNGQFTNPGDSFAIVRLDGDGLAKLDRWVVPGPERVPDSDFGGSPTLFDATLYGTPTQMVGACNKNGFYYAWDQGSLSSGPVWRRRIGAGASGGYICIAAAIFDSATHGLFLGSNSTTIGGTQFAGSVRRVDPATGIVDWARGLTGGAVMGSPTLNGSGVLAAGTYNVNQLSANRVYLLNATTGAIVHTISPGSPVFAQPVFADQYLLVAARNGGLTAYSPGP